MECKQGGRDLEGKVLTNTVWRKHWSVWFGVSLYSKLTVNHRSPDLCVLNFSLIGWKQSGNVCTLVTAFVTYMRCRPTHSSHHFLTGQLITMTSLLPDGVVGSTEVDEEIPAPVSHGQQVSHAAKIHGQQTCTTPDGGHSPGCHPHIWILHGQGLHLPVQVVRALKRQRSHVD